MTQDVEMKELPAPSNSVSAAPPSTLQRKINLYIQLHIPISVYIALIFGFGVLDYRLNFGYWCEISEIGDLGFDCFAHLLGIAC